MNTITALLGRRRTERERSLQEYVAVMGRADNPKSGDEDLLEALMGDLNLTTADVEADAARFKQQNQLEADMAKLPALKAEAKKLQAAEEQTHAAHEKANEEWRLARVALARHNTMVGQAVDAKQTLEKLQASFPRLVGKE